MIRMPNSQSLGPRPNRAKFNTLGDAEREAPWTAPACWSFRGRRSLLRGGAEQPRSSAPQPATGTKLPPPQSASKLAHSKAFGIALAAAIAVLFNATIASSAD